MQKLSNLQPHLIDKTDSAERFPSNEHFHNKALATSAQTQAKRRSSKQTGQAQKQPSAQEPQILADAETETRNQSGDTGLNSTTAILHNSEVVGTTDPIDPTHLASSAYNSATPFTLAQVNSSALHNYTESSGLSGISSTNSGTIGLNSAAASTAWTMGMALVAVGAALNQLRENTAALKATNMGGTPAPTETPTTPPTPAPTDTPTPPPPPPPPPPDRTPPTLNITSDKNTLIAGQKAVLTFTFSENVSGFNIDQISVSNGSLSQLQSLNSGSVYTAIYTPNPDYSGPVGSVTVMGTSYRDSAGNQGTVDTTREMVVDTAAAKISTIRASATADTITLYFDSALDASHLPMPDNFSVLQGGRSLSISSVTRPSSATNQLLLTLANDNASDLQAGTFSLAYTADAAHPIKDLRGNLTPSFMQGIVADGYIAGARIFIDTNRNGLGESNEDTGIVTGSDGSFILPVQVNNDPLLAIGGVNTDTGLLNTMTISAPSGSMLLNPLTTLVQQVIQSTGADSTTAANQVKAALGLPSHIDLIRYDPLGAGDGDALVVQKAAAQVAALVTHASSNTTIQGLLLENLANTIADSGLNPAPLDLSDISLLITLFENVPLSEDEKDTAEFTLSALLNDIHNVDDLADISQWQLDNSQDTVKPAAPTIKAQLATGMNQLPSVLIALPGNRHDGSDASAGDTLTVTDDANNTLTHVLTRDDVSAGYVRLNLNSDVSQTASLYATITDQAGHVSTVAQYNQPGSDTLELASVFGPAINMMLQQLSNVSLPMVGQLNDVAAVIQDKVLQILANLPTAHLHTSPPPQTQPIAAQAFSDFASDTLEDVQTPTPMLMVGTAAPMLMVGTAAPMLMASSSINYWELLNGDGSTTTITFDDTAPSDDQTSPSDNFDDPNAPTEDPTDSSPLPADTPVKTLIGRATGTQFDLSQQLTNFWPNAFELNSETGEYKFNYKVPVSLMDWPMLGELGIEGAQARIDANLGGYFTVEINLEGKLDAKKYVSIDTNKSKLEVALNLGLSDGSMTAAQLGPLIMTASNIDSKRVDSTLTRTDTGLSGTVTAYLKDNDGIQNSSLLMNTDTIAKFFNQIADGSFKISDWYGLRTDLKGQLSAAVTAQTDLSTLLPDSLDTTALVKALGLPDSMATDTNNFLTQIDKLLGIFNPQVSAKVTVPVSMSWDSADANTTTTDYGKVFFDDIQIGLDTMLNSTMGPGLDMLDKVMAPMYLISNFMNAPRMDLPTELVSPVIEDAPWPFESLGDALNAPGDLLNAEWAKAMPAFDRNGDDKISTFESLRGSIDVYQGLAEEIALVWNAFNRVGGAASALSAALDTVAAGSGSVITGIIAGITATVTQGTVTEANPKGLSPIELVQEGMDKVEQVFKAIDQLQSLRASFDQGMAELSALEQSTSTNLTYSMGSYVWDVTNNSTRQVKNAYDDNSLDYKLVPGRDPFAGITVEQARALIYNQVKEGTASAETLSPTVFKVAGIDYSDEAKYLAAGVTGVTAQNIQGICDILNAKGVSKTFQLDWSTGKPQFNSEGTLIPVDETELFDQPFELELKEIRHYLGLVKLTEGSMDLVPAYSQLVLVKQREKWDTFYGCDVSMMLYELGIIKDSDRVLTTESQVWQVGMSNISHYDYLYGGRSADYILREMIKNQGAKDLDTAQELKDLWDVQMKWEKLMANQTTDPMVRGWWTDNPDDEDLNQFFLSFDDFQRVGLDILSRNETVRTSANEMIRDWSYDETSSNNPPSYFAGVYRDVQTYINEQNALFYKNIGTDGDAAATEVIKRFMAMAEKDDTEATLLDFTTLGVSKMSADKLNMFNGVLNSTRVNSEQVNSVSKVRDIALAIDTLYQVVNDQTVDPYLFYRHMIHLLGKDTVELQAKIRDTSTSIVPESVKSFQLYLLQSLLKAQDWLEVDTYSELDKLAKLTTDIEKLSMSDQRIWATLGGGSVGSMEIRERGKAIATDGVDKINLTVEDLQLLGFSNLTEEHVTEFTKALKAYNVTNRVVEVQYDRHLSANEVPAINPKPLDYTALAKIAKDYSQMGFFQELLAKVPSLQALWNQMTDMGFELPFLSDTAFLKKLWNQEPVDLLTFNPDLNKLSLDISSSLLNLDVLKLTGLNAYTDPIYPMSVPLNVDFQAKVSPRLSFGIDTGGLIDAAQIPYDVNDAANSILKKASALLNGIYINDLYSISGSMVDLPELEASLSFNAFLGAQIGKAENLFNAFANLRTGFTFDASLDLANPGADGKVRLANLIDELFTAPQDILDLQASLGVYLKAQSGLSINTDTSNMTGDLSIQDSLLKAALEVISTLSGTNTFTLGAEGSFTQTLIDNNPSTEAPSLSDLWLSLMNNTSQAVIPV